MGSNWEPDDSVIEGDGAIDRLREALKRHGFDMEQRRIFTSREAGMDLVRNDLMRRGTPSGVDQWQLPFYLKGPAFVFITSTSPGTVVPEHAHSRDLFRMVIDGSMRIGGVELTSGDWMFVPAGVKYSYAAGFGCCHLRTFHSYG